MIKTLGPVILFLGLICEAMAGTLEKITVVPSSSSDTVVQFTFKDVASVPKLFLTDNPTRIVADFFSTKSAIPADLNQQNFETGLLRSVLAAQSGERTRVVMDLSNHVTFTTRVNDKTLELVLKTVSQPLKKDAVSLSSVDSNVQNAATLKTYDFRRDKSGAGQFVVDVTPNMVVDLSQEGQKIKVRFVGASISPNLLRKLDVSDFGTPISEILVEKIPNGVEAVLTGTGSFDSMAYQTNNQYTLEVRPLTAQEVAAKQRKEFSYTGERLSMNFQDIDVRQALQLIADFTGLNMVASDSVTGKLTLKLQNVPWDQALDLVMRTKGLNKRQVGNVILIAPSEEIASREKQDLQATQQVQDLSPLRSEFIQIDYASAADLATLLKADKNSLLSTRGSVSVDARTNTLLVQETPEKIEEVRALIERLDVPVQQVLIDTRVVSATDEVEKALGVSFATTFTAGGGPRLGFSGDQSSAVSVAQGNPPNAQALTDRLNVSLPNNFSDTTSIGRFGLAVADFLNGTMLDMELDALESEGLITVVASPRLITSNQTPAYIESGEELPYNESTSSGAASIAFKKAVLRLEVTPQITPDQKISMDLQINQDSKGEAIGTVFAINTNVIHTKVLVDNGETVVLGGVYQQNKTDTTTRIPYLWKLPVVGWLFRANHLDNKRTELIIFVTPKIITGQLF